MAVVLKKVLFLQKKEYFLRLLGEELFHDGCYECFFLDCPVILNIHEYIAGFDAVASCLDHSQEAVALIKVANKVGIKTIYVSDGTYDIGNSIYNPSLKRRLNYQLFSVKYDYMLIPDIIGGKVFTSHSSIVYSYLPRHAVCASRHDINGRVLVSTATSAYFSLTEFNRLCELIKLVADICDGQGLDVKYRIYDKKILKRLSISADDNLVDCELGEALEGVKVLVTTPSTLVYSAAISRIPVGLLSYRNVFITQPYSFLMFDYSSIKCSLEASPEELKYRARVQSSFVDFNDPIDIFNEIVSSDFAEAGVIKKYTAPFVPFESIARSVYRRLIRFDLFRVFFNKLKGL